ncbi:chlorophyll synthesis pathway protein BchC [Ectothiorhodospira lacustris]|uniref:chlorophyll synthesis pathway protein BchC n=1 Tax=Ectothiorhodospira lacustris TaxID=2899127 RepID=UPI001EE965F4|nr:chlorophyll synthesis pathway protein BchC [Ectothiorhodospira lacustris]MCG5501758.1 chlorophyll synthesis pathway protein BchC [Ectothiorhodospira lacustris]MCG5511170.1 chlorophyll synthesis pathway protein BchC [Ectothiorhodospira lacustris]MCG5522834.1 chlorophyll synthesis pathway protein BchC [Ectothiorhodospira lacustris]
MKATAVVIQQPESLEIRELELTAPGAADVVVAIDWSGISTGTERLLWTGKMPSFPGMGYPLVPGYESVGRITQAGPDSGRQEGEWVFVPGASCYGEVKGLFGGASSRVVVPGSKVVPIPDRLGEEGVLLALAATAYHAIFQGQPADEAASFRLPDLIIGHGVLGRLLARVAVAAGASPVVWELNESRAAGAEGYAVMHPDQDGRRDYHTIVDVSGDSALLDTLIARLAPGGEVVLAGFYSQPLSFAFPPAFMREARIRCAAEWRAPDLAAVKALIDSGRLSLGGLITHRRPAAQADEAYRTAFGDPECLKMVLDWRASQ